MAVKILISVIVVIILLLLFGISRSLVQPIWDNVKNKRIPDHEGMVLGYAGYVGCIVILYMWYYYIFG
jgi:hypothetical protein